MLSYGVMFCYVMFCCGIYRVVCVCVCVVLFVALCHVVCVVCVVLCLLFVLFALFVLICKSSDR